MLVAGGANFPDAPPWEDGKKVWHDRIFSLDLSGEGGQGAKWVVAGKLPAPSAYGASVSFAGRVILIGGDDGLKASKRVFSYTWDGKLGDLVEYPSLPSTCTNLCAALVKKEEGGVIYVAGGLSLLESQSVQALKSFWSLELGSDGLPGDGAEWMKLKPWPGPGRFQAASGVIDEEFYLFGGLQLEEGKTASRVFPPLKDAYAYSSKTGNWRRLQDMPEGRAAVPSPALRIGEAHLLMVGGGDPDSLEWLANNPGKTIEHHPGWTLNCLAYNKVVDRWAPFGNFPTFSGDKIDTSRVTVNTVEYGGRWFLPSGEARPGVRSPRVLSVKAVHEGGFTTLDQGVLLVYLLLLVGIGWRLSKRGKTTGDYFLAGGRIPWWAAGLSVFATGLSSLTFTGIPALAYKTDFAYYVGILSIPLIAPLIIYFFMPAFRRANITTVYEYLEIRFSIAVRLFASVSFILFQLGRMTIVLYLPALALKAVTGIDIYTCVVLMVILATVYTYLGGIEAVIWTDVLQAVVLVGGAIIAIFVIAGSVEGGFGGLYSEALSAGKMATADFDWGPESFTREVFWVILLGGIFQQIATYGSDQAVVQRYLTTADEKSAAKGIWANAFLAIPIPLLLFFVGAGLFVYYQQHPAELSPELKNDQIFPLFMVQALPPGITGLVIAGVLAASMSTLDSSMNSVSAVVVTDFYRRFKPDLPEDRYLRAARLTTIALGVLALVAGLVLAALHESGNTRIQSMFDEYLRFLGLVLGPLGGVMCLAIFTRRSNSTGVLSGAFIAVSTLLLVKYFTDVSHLLYSVIGVVTCFCVGYL
ncbi:MAG: sodium/solute symporter, partial [Planctomycetota bacterium]|nr:sodium/solute symporter [Planctomycetota bacterium]